MKPVPAFVPTHHRPFVRELLKLGFSFVNHNYPGVAMELYTHKIGTSESCETRQKTSVFFSKKHEGFIPQIVHEKFWVGGARIRNEMQFHLKHPRNVRQLLSFLL